MSSPARLPILVLTGFLGSGKTSLLNRLLQHWPDSAILINEFGAVPVDQRLIEQHQISMTVLAGGCLCCKVRDALAPTLKNLWMAWNSQNPKPFKRLIIESSGVASPEPVLDVLLRERWLSQRLSLQAVVTALAVPSGEEQLARFPEAMAQVAWADVLVLTHGDLADSESQKSLESRLTEIAPFTPRLSASFGQIEPERLLDVTPSTFRRVPTGEALPDHGFHSLSLKLETPIAWPSLRSGLESLLRQHGPRLLRVKGVVYWPDDPSPWAIQVAGGRISPPVRLESRLADDGIGRLVFITDGLMEGLGREWMESSRGIQMADFH